MDFSNWIPLPENRAARAAIAAIGDCLVSRRRTFNPLYLHGPPGSGKSHLINALISDATAHMADLVVLCVSALDDKTFQELRTGSNGATKPSQEPLRQADLLIIENLQHLDQRAAESLAALLDWRTTRGLQIILTATEGPARLKHLPIRLASRLAVGLVVGLEPLSPLSRIAYLEDRLARRDLAVDPAVVGWVAKHTTGSGRQLESAVNRLEALAKGNGRPPILAETLASFKEDEDALRLTVERIASRVSTYFHVQPRSLRSRRRSRDALLARQVSMYLARRVTGLSLQQIGAYFGGRDHSTVLHACRKVEASLASDASLSGAVRQLLAEVA